MEIDHEQFSTVILSFQPALVAQSDARQIVIRLLVRSQILVVSAGLGGSVGCVSDWRQGGRGFDPRRSRQYSFVEFDHKIFYGHSLPLIQEGQLSVSGERMCTILVNHLED